MGLLLLLPLLAQPVLALPAPGRAEPLRVFVSVLPLQTFVERIGGDQVEVRALVRPGYNPHTFDPSPQQIAALADADLYVLTGVPFETAWMPRIRAANPRMAVLDARSGIALQPLPAHHHDDHEGPTEGHAAGPDAHHPAEHGHDHAHGHAAEPRDHAAPAPGQPPEAGQGAHKDHEHDNAHDHTPPQAHPDATAPRLSAALDPHIWTSPRLALRMLASIRDELSRLAPAHTELFHRRHAAYAAEVQALDAELRALLAPLHGRAFLVFHPAWGYFAASYGLQQVPIEHEGKAPGARALAALIAQARAEGIRVVFVQPQFDRRQAQQVAQAIDGGVIAVDPLAPDYVANLRRVAQQMAQALQP